MNIKPIYGIILGIMGNIRQFSGIDFEAGFLLFGDEFEEIPGVYIVYTEKSVLDIGTTIDLKSTLETHINTPEWLKQAADEEIYIAFLYEDDPQHQQEIESYLKQRVNPLCTTVS